MKIYPFYCLFDHSPKGKSHKILYQHNLQGNIILKSNCLKKQLHNLKETRNQFMTIYQAKFHNFLNLTTQAIDEHIYTP